MSLKEPAENCNCPFTGKACMGEECVLYVSDKSECLFRLCLMDYHREHRKHHV